jgi:hypothetical protein
MLNFFSAHEKGNILKLYLLHFAEIYPPSNIPLPEERVGTAWELSKLEKKYFFLSPYLNVVSFTNRPPPLSLLLYLVLKWLNYNYQY